jgi:membrane protein YdbS with pleckstrin-like domain
VYDLVRGPLLKFLRVPAAPTSPVGSPESIRVFRAGANFYKWSVIRWALKQTAVGVGIGAALTMLGPFYSFGIPDTVWPAWLRVSWLVMEAILAVGFILQLPVTYFIQRLGYEMRWYIVTDRSLRIRSGTWFVEERTMTFANIQQVNLTQGPLQGLLGIADLEVTSAGGGAGKKQSGTDGPNTHTGCFQGVDNAETIRDLILERLRLYRNAGLGDPDEPPEKSEGALEAAQEALTERVSCERRSP